MKINRYNFKRVHGPFLQQNFWTSFKPEFGRDMHVKEFLHNFRSCKVSSGLPEGCLSSGRAAWVWPWPGLDLGLRALGLQNPHLISKLGETPGQEPAALQTQRQVLWLLWPMLEHFFFTWGLFCSAAGDLLCILAWVPVSVSRDRRGGRGLRSA